LFNPALFLPLGKFGNGSLQRFGIFDGKNAGFLVDSGHESGENFARPKLDKEVVALLPEETN
jgi:hypothetical protein